MSLNGKIALVTGAGRGLGKAIALKLAEEGATVAVNSLTEKNAQQTAREITDAGGKAIAVPADVGIYNEVQEMFKITLKEFGDLDILVNNAGISPKDEKGRKRYVVDMPREEWERVVAVNLNGIFYCAQNALKVMLPKKEGCIVNMSSLVYNTYAEITGAHYMATKAGVVGLTKALAGEVTGSGIRVNAIAPGRIKTEMVAQADKELNERFIKTIPAGKFGKPREIADGVLFLVSDNSSYISGTILHIDGGGVKIV